MFSPAERENSTKKSKVEVEVEGPKSLQPWAVVVVVIRLLAIESLSIDSRRRFHPQPNSSDNNTMVLCHAIAKRESSKACVERRVEKRRARDWVSTLAEENSKLKNSTFLLLSQKKITGPEKGQPQWRRRPNMPKVPQDGPLELRVHSERKHLPFPAVGDCQARSSKAGGAESCGATKGSAGKEAEELFEFFELLGFLFFFFFFELF